MEMTGGSICTRGICILDFPSPTLSSRRLLHPLGTDALTGLVLIGPNEYLYYWSTVIDVLAGRSLRAYECARSFFYAQFPPPLSCEVVIEVMKQLGSYKTPPAEFERQLLAAQAAEEEKAEKERRQKKKAEEKRIKEEEEKKKIEQEAFTQDAEAMAAEAEAAMAAMREEEERLMIEWEQEEKERAEAEERKRVAEEEAAKRAEEAEHEDDVILPEEGRNEEHPEITKDDISNWTAPPALKYDDIDNANLESGILLFLGRFCFYGFVLRELFGTGSGYSLEYRFSGSPRQM